MDCFERYYRRSYNTLNKLIEVYKNGYDKDKTLKFRQELISKYKSNPKVAQSEFNNLMFTKLFSVIVFRYGFISFNADIVVCIELYETVF